jgi:hypothetical protein
MVLLYRIERGKASGKSRLDFFAFAPFSSLFIEPVPKLIDCALNVPGIAGGTVLEQPPEPVPKLIDCALNVPGIAGGTVLGQALAVFQAFSLTKLRISRLLSQN